MKVFWGVLVVLLLGAAVAVAVRFGAGDQAEPPSDTTAPPSAQQQVPEPNEPNRDTGARDPAPIADAPDPSSAPDSKLTPTGEPPQPVEKTQDELPVAAQPEPTPPAPEPILPAEAPAPAPSAPTTEPVIEEAQTPTPTEPEPEVKLPATADGENLTLDAALGLPSDDKADQPLPETEKEPVAAEKSPEPNPVATDPAPPAIPSTTAAPATAVASGAAAAGYQTELQPDGSVIIDARFVVKGEGTKEKPYEIPWEFLVSAGETYQPRLGQKKLPERMGMLNDKFVKITGYVCFPIMAESQDEMLVMLNQWDGCCIGVPPTPFDAVEVKLSTPAPDRFRLRNTGTLTGRFKVDPYLVKDWLVSLYTMDQAVLTTDPN